MGGDDGTAPCPWLPLAAGCGPQSPGPVLPWRQPPAARSDRVKPRTAQFLDELIHRGKPAENTVDLIGWIGQVHPPAQESAARAQLELNRGPGPEAQRLAHLRWNRNLAFRRENAPHWESFAFFTFIVKPQNAGLRQCARAGQAWSGGCPLSSVHLQGFRPEGGANSDDRPASRLGNLSTRCNQNAAGRPAPGPPPPHLSTAGKEVQGLPK